MTKKIYIGLWFILGMSACSTVQMPPIDDAYHWPDKTVSATSTTPTTPANRNTSENSTEPSVSQTSQASSETPKMEYINVQDTTITVRIKK